MLRFALVGFLAAHVAMAERVWQPIIDYTLSFPGDRPDAAPEINPFENFTHFASDFGWMGPGENRIDARDGVIQVRPGEGWAGAWHSLAGLAVEEHRTLNPQDVIGLGDHLEPSAILLELTLNAVGSGRFHVELADAKRNVVWQSPVQFVDGETEAHTFILNAETLGPIKFLNWIAEPESEVAVSSLGFIVEQSDIPIEEWMFRISLGKLRRCHDPATGLTRDRGHLPAGSFDSIPATGMHALASALGAVEGLLSREIVAKEIQRTLEAFQALPKAAGFLPHFTHTGADGKPTIHPGTEFSTVDTSIALHGLLLAARIMNLDEAEQQVATLIANLNFDALTDTDGWISHGLREDGKTLLTSQWKDWGGESALVLAMEAMVPNRAPRGRKDKGGRVYGGVGFIGEIQSLFYPDFDRSDPDLISAVVWPEARGELLQRQMGYHSASWPDSAATRAGVFGLSAGESGMPGAGYSANGVDFEGLRWIHPHAMILGLALSGGEEAYRGGLGKLASAGVLFPRGLPENFDIDLKFHNPMQGSLNASFEALAAYHGWRRGRGVNHLDEAARGSPLMRQAAARFYGPEKP